MSVRRKVALILIAVLFVQSLVMTTAVYAVEPTIIVRYALTCNGLDGGIMPVDFDNEFDSNDDFIQFYARIQVINGPVNLVERWYDPNGFLLASREHSRFTGGLIYNYIETKSLCDGQVSLPQVTGWYKVELSLVGSGVPIVSIPFLYDAHSQK